MSNFIYYADTYLKIKESELKAGTFYHYNGIVNSYILPYFKDKDIQDIKASELRLWLLNFDRANKTLLHYISVLSGIFKEAYYDEIITKNPCDFIKKPKLQKSNVVPFREDEIKKILSNAKNINFKNYLYIAFYTGMRSGEIIGLKKIDIDFENNLINISRSRSRFGDLSPKTVNGIRSVPIFNLLKDHLKSFYDLHDNEYLFINQYGKPYVDTGTFLSKQWKPLLKKLNIPYRKLYNTRHTFATMMLVQGHTSPHNLAKILGHRDSQMVHEVYAKFMHGNKFDFDLDIDLY